MVQPIQHRCSKRVHHMRWAVPMLIVAAIGAVRSDAAAQDWRTINSMRRVGSEESLRVNVEYGAGRLTISPGAENSLYKAMLRYDANVFRPMNRYEAGELDIGIEGGSIKDDGALPDYRYEKSQSHLTDLGNSDAVHEGGHSYGHGEVAIPPY